MVALLSTPYVPYEGDMDLERNYFAVAPWVYRLTAAFVAFACVADLLVPDEVSAPRRFTIAITSTLLLMSFNKSRRLHRIGPVLLWIVHVIKFSVGTRW